MTHTNEILILILFGYSVVVTAFHLDLKRKLKEKEDIWREIVRYRASETIHGRRERIRGQK